MQGIKRVVSTSTQWVKKNKYKAMYIAIFIAVGGMVILQSLAWTVTLNGEVLGLVRGRQAVEEAMAERLQKVRDERGLAVGISSSVGFTPRLSFAVDDHSLVIETLLPRLEFGKKAAVIVVDGEPVVALANRGEAEALLEQVKNRFLDAKANTEVEKVQFLQETEIIEEYRSIEEIHEPDGALNVLLYGSERRLTHTVARGESFWTIASRHRLGVSVLAAANPQIRPERLQIGATLNLTIQEPFLEVQTIQRVTYNQSVPFPTTTVVDPSMWAWDRRVRTPGRAGTQAVTARVTAINGKEENREILTRVQVAPPITQVVARGTKQAPTMSTGKFIWPTTGRVTSPFGRRWDGFHEGVDIGAPSGTQIRAAERGIVSFSGWGGGYGNMVRIEHGDGYATLYAHASRLLVSVNDVVERGQVIALVGNTGRSFGPHLHFEIRRHDSPLDPLTFFR
ncbi:MAG: Murein hydrolase activator EnvC [Firmicutes bacterium]|nr:Murein hydrolase activator EnvC [Bacillota bacterium]